MRNQFRDGLLRGRVEEGEAFRRARSKVSACSVQSRSPLFNDVQCVESLRLEAHDGCFPKGAASARTGGTRTSHAIGGVLVLRGRPLGERLLDSALAQPEALLHLIRNRGQEDGNADPRGWTCRWTTEKPEDPGMKAPKTPLGDPRLVSSQKRWTNHTP